jgi:hypothetical protein
MDRILKITFRTPTRSGRLRNSIALRRKDAAVAGKRLSFFLAILGVLAGPVLAQEQSAIAGQESVAAQHRHLPPRAAAAERFLAQRGWTPASGRLVGRGSLTQSNAMRKAITQTTAATQSWQSLGPAAVETANFGLVTGRVTALALDPSDATGNRLYLGTTGGGVWAAQNAGTSNASTVEFTPLTDQLSALNGATDASTSIGALTVQPGGTGVILAGTGDPNDALDSYYGGGILRSTDGGNTWSLITHTFDAEDGLGFQDFSFLGEGFAGFAWSTANTQVVVAAVSQAYEGAVVNAVESGTSYEGLYYSQDSGATWHLATIEDGASNYVQGPAVAFASPDGNAATSVVWNSVRKMFYAAVRFHGYYQSADGVTWTRMTAQPGGSSTTLKTSLCPANLGEVGSIACPIFRGTLAVNPSTGDTFAWTVDIDDQDQGLWQDQCAISGGACTNTSVTFSKKWSTAALEENTQLGAVTIVDGSYTLALAAVPGGLGAGQDTLLLAGADDLWKCSLAMGCAWRNTTNAASCMSAQVGPYQHALAWNAANPQEIFAGNDSGLWRSMDAIGETGQACSTTDAKHFQNLNAGLGSLAEVVSLSQVTTTPYAMMAGLGVNGTAGVKGSAATADWPQILGGYGGPVAIDPTNANNWYVNNQAGVSIYACSQTGGCTPSAFGTSPVVTDADVNGDGLTMATPAPFLVDPLDATQLLIGTCRVWRGPANGSGWSWTNAISPILSTGVTSGVTSGACSGNGVIRSMAALPLANGSEKIYLGMYGSLNGGANLPGHVLSAIVNPASAAAPTWKDVTLGPVKNDVNSMNYYGMDISSIYIDPHDTTGNTVYVTVEGADAQKLMIRILYGSTDGGAHWQDLTANLPETPANSVVVDPQSAGTVYVATDEGVYFTTQVSNCPVASSTCWSVYGSGLPAAPVVALSASPAGAASPVLVAGTYGRGIWQLPLASVGMNTTTATASPNSLTFTAQQSSLSAAQTVTITNTGNVALTVTAIALPGAFSETDNCVNTSVAAGASCAVQVVFAPTTLGSQQGLMTISANVSGGQLTTVALSGTATAPGVVTLSPASLSFGQVQVGQASALLEITVNNSNTSATPITSLTVSGPFSIATDSCGTTSLAAQTSCQMQLEFSPTQAGAAAGTLTLVYSGGTQTIALSGTGQSPATDSLSPASLSFASTAVGALSSAQTVTLTNSGGELLTGIAVTASGPFQSSSTCGTQLTGPASCTISVVFAPGQQGSLTGTLSVADALRTQTVALSGTGVAPPALSVSPSSLSFSAQQTGVASDPQTITVTNVGGLAMANVGFQTTGAAAASYAVSSTNCGAALNSGSSCAAQIVFTPPATGAITAALTVSSSTPGVVPFTVSLNGSGLVGTGVSGTPADINFSNVGVGQTSSPQTVTFSNTGGIAIDSLTLAVTGPFAIAQNNCTMALEAGAYCTATVVFAPTASGSATGTLTANSQGLTTPASIALAGTGFDFAVATSGSNSQTVAAGLTAYYTATINPANGASGAFTFSCGTLPANALCLFNPATTTVNAGATGSVTVEISTGAFTSARAERPAEWTAVPLACGLLVLPLALRRRRKAFWMALLLVLVVAGAATGCTSSGGLIKSGSSGSGDSGGTPAGTYSIPVTVTSTGVSHTVTVTLTVD